MPFRRERQIVWLVIFFLLLGLTVLFSATGILGLQKYGSEFYFVERQALSVFVGVALMVFLANVRYQTWERLAIPILVGQVLLLCATLFTPLGHHAQGSTRWLRLGPFSLQPSELSKVAVAIYVASLLSLKEKMKRSLGQWIFTLLPVAFLCVLVLRQPDLGGTILLCAITLGIFFIAGAKLTYVMGCVGVGGAFFIFSMIHTEYRRKRLLAFLNPWADPQGTGFQAVQSFLSIHSGHITGTGLGNGNSKLFYLPEVHTDFVFSLLGEELGFVGAVFFLGLFLYFAYLMFKTAFRAPDRFGCFLAFGLALSLVLQVIVNVGGVIGLMPLKGLPLPFISWGRSAIIVQLAMVGILLNIARQGTKREAEKEAA